MKQQASASTRREVVQWQKQVVGCQSEMAEIREKITYDYYTHSIKETAHYPLLVS